MDAAPDRRLPRAARTYWRAKLALQAVGVLVVAAFVLSQAGGPSSVLWIVVAVGVIVAVVVPELRWRRWRYAIGEEELDLLHGVLVARRTLVPIRRVQHVDTEQGPLQGSFGLSGVTFHTAAGRVELPALTTSEADAVRRRVADLAKTLDDV